LDQQIGSKRRKKKSLVKTKGRGEEVGACQKRRGDGDNSGGFCVVDVYLQEIRVVPRLCLLLLVARMGEFA
jgi:hypothetical protein